MGSIRELIRKDRKISYHAEVRLKGFPPQRRACRTKSQAKQWIQDTESSIRDGRYKIQNVSKKYTVKDLIDRFISQYLPKQPKYYEKKVQLLNRWKEELGGIIIHDLSSSHIVEVRDKLRSETTAKKRVRTGSTVNRYLAAFSKVLSVGVKEWEWLDENPMRKVSKERENRGRDRFLTPEEIDRLLQACKGSKNPYLFPIISLAITTGMRYGEIMNLKWTDINFNLQLITLQETKNGDRRIVSLPNPVILILKTIPGFEDTLDDLIFKSLKVPFSKRPLSIRKSFDKALKTARIENFRFHDLRHTAASYLAMNGATQGALMSILGHHSPQMTYKYAHYSPDHIKNILQKTAEKLIPSNLLPEHQNV